MEDGSSPEGIKLQKSIEVPSDATLGQMVEALGKADFDPNQVRYESPLLEVPRPNDLRALGNFQKSEVLVVGKSEHGKSKMRVITGTETSVSTESLRPKSNLAPIAEATKDMTLREAGNVIKDATRGYLILDVDDETGRVFLPDTTWSFTIHNHPEVDLPSPSYGDIESLPASKIVVIVGRKGMMVMQASNNLPPERINKLPPNAQNFTTTRELVYDDELMQGVKSAAEKQAREEIEASEPDLRGGAFVDKLLRLRDLTIAEMVGIEIKTLEWDKDAEEIQKICDSLLPASENQQVVE